MNRTDAKMIAEELYKLVRKELRTVAENLVIEDTDEFLTVDEAADFMRLSKSTLYKKRKVIPCVKVNGALRYSKNALIKYMNKV